MKTLHVGVITAVLFAIVIAVPRTVAVTPSTVQATGPKLTHAQEVWRTALEWCESNGNESAVNPKDLDNTPSYYSWQFKPGTWRIYGEKYGVIPKGMTDAEIMVAMQDYDTTQTIVGYMVLDKTVDWSIQFPWCSKKLGGHPPR